MNPLFRVLLHLVFPSICPSCQSDLPLNQSGPVCRSCLVQFPFNPLCEPMVGKNLRLVYSAAEFKGPVRDLLIKLKYGGREDLAPWLARRALEAVQLRAGSFDCLVPVPVSPWTEVRRGYNQAELLARELSLALDLPIARDLLRSRWWGKSQTRLDRRQRRRNAKNRFSFQRNVRKRGLRVLLVDDVKTTGATLAQCATLLRRAGAADISAFVIARDPLF